MVIVNGRHPSAAYLLNARLMRLPAPAWHYDGSPTLHNAEELAAGRRRCRGDYQQLLSGVRQPDAGAIGGGDH